MAIRNNRNTNSNTTTFKFNSKTLKQLIVDWCKVRRTSEIEHQLIIFVLLKLI